MSVKAPARQAPGLNFDAAAKVAAAKTTIIFRTNIRGTTLALFPLQANFRGDFVVLVVPVDDGDDMNVVAEKVAHHAVGLRVAPRDAPKRVYYNGEELPSETTIANSGIQPMDWIEVGYVE